MGNPYFEQPVIHNDQGHKNHHDETQLLLFQGSNDDTIDVKHFSAPGRSAGQYNREQHNQVSLLIVPLGTHDSHTFQTDEVSDTPIAYPTAAVAPCPDSQSDRNPPQELPPEANRNSIIGRNAQTDGQTFSPYEALEKLQAPPDNAKSDAAPRSDAPPQSAPAVVAAPDSQITDHRAPQYTPQPVPLPDNYFDAPAVVHKEKHHKDTDHGGSLAAGFVNGYESTSYDRQIFSSPGQYAEQTVRCKSNEANIGWVVPVYSRDSSDTQWYKESNVPLGPCMDDRPQPYYSRQPGR